MEIFITYIKPALQVGNLILLGMLLVAIWQVRILIKTNNEQISNQTKEINVQTQQMYAQTYIAYTEKYDSIIEKIQYDYWKKREESDFLFPEYDGNLRVHLHNYYQLCCQQFYLNHFSLISEKIWKKWEVEIVHNLSLNSLKTYWNNEEGEYFKLYPEFKEYVTRLHATTEDEDIV